MGESLETLDLDDIIDMNRRLIKTAGGFFVDPDNLHNRNSLEALTKWRTAGVGRLVEGITSRLMPAVRPLC